MGETIRQTYEGVLKLLETVIIPDWGTLIGLIPVGILLVVLAWLVRLGMRWLGFYVAQPDLPPSYRTARSLQSVIFQRLALVPAGALLIALALTVLPRRVGPLPQVGWDMAVLIFGILVALTGVCLAVAAADTADHADEHGLASVRSLRQAILSVLVAIDRIPAAYRPLAGVAAGLAIILIAFLLAGASPAAGRLPEVKIPLVLLGVLLGLGSMARSILAWDRTEDSDGAKPAGGTGHAVATRSGPSARHPGAFA